MATAEEPSNENKSPQIRPRSNSYDRAVSDDQPEVKKPPSPSDPPNKPSENKHYDDDIYVIKWIEFNRERLPILLQNINGPCPLLALANILLLKKQVTISCKKKFKEFYFL
jgi:hypothetical protein